MMTRPNAFLTRRAFGALAASALPSAAAGANSGEHIHAQYAQFLRELAWSFERQVLALDMEDINTVLSGLREPSLRVGVAGGADRADRAAKAALPEQAQPVRQALVVITFPAGEGRLSEYKTVFDVVRSRLDPDTFIIFGGCHDERLAAGSARVSVLVG